MECMRYILGDIASDWLPYMRFLTRHNKSEFELAMHLVPGLLVTLVIYD